jgi:hypothetical protein
MSGPARLVLALLAMALGGCGVDLAGGAGAKAGNVVGFGRLAASTRFGTPLNEKGILLGMNLESRAEQDVGSRWSSGVMLGYGYGPPSFDGWWGCEGYAEFGVPLRLSYSGFDDAYAGLGLALPFNVSANRELIDLNQSSWILKPRIEIVPFGRARGYFGQDEPNFSQRVEISGGLAFRFRVMTDLF